jgi:hypothetical protein
MLPQQKVQCVELHMERGITGRGLGWAGGQVSR